MGLSPCFISPFSTSVASSFAARGFAARESGAGCALRFDMAGPLMDAVAMDVNNKVGGCTNMHVIYMLSLGTAVYAHNWEKILLRFLFWCHNLPRKILGVHSYLGIAIYPNNYISERAFCKKYPVLGTSVVNNHTLFVVLYNFMIPLFSNFCKISL